MRVFALSDPHLSFGTPDKEMDRFGPQWVDHPATMARAWDEEIRPEDVVLVPGDISWAKKMDGAAPDLAWLGERPGTKVLVKGNHDYWWQSRAKVASAAPDGIVVLEASAARIGPLALAGTRLWDVPGIDYGPVTVWHGEAISPEPDPRAEQAALKIYRREVARIDRALAAMDRDAALRIFLTHYPPVGPDPEPNELTDRFERAGIDHVVFGHLHSLDRGSAHRIGGVLGGVRYHLTSCDWVDFRPTLIASL